MTCQTHNIEYEGRCPQCRTIAARAGYYRRMGRPVPEDIGPYWVPGAACSVCQKPILTEADKHTRTCTHRECGDPHSNVWRKGDPCTRCGLPVSINEKQPRYNAHAKCFAAQIEETKIRRRIRHAAYKKEKAKASKRMKPKFVGPQVREPQPAPVIIAGDVQVRRLPSLMPTGLRDMFGTHGPARLATDDLEVR